jgi:hypothetical protein
MMSSVPSTYSDVPVSRNTGGKVRAVLNYIAADMDYKPVYFNDDLAGSNLPFEPHEVEIEDASQFAEPPRLEVEGFELIRHATSQRNLYEGSDTVIEPYSGEMEALIQRRLNADFVHVNRKQNTRHQVQTWYDAKNRKTPPVNFVHSDSSYAGGPHYTSLQGKEQARTVHRYLTVNMWRLVSPPPTSLPLAVLDPRSVAPEDLVPAVSTIRGGENNPRTCIEMLLFRYNPAHRWVYFSTQGYDDVLVFKQFDSDASKPWFTPHSAFANNTVSKDVHPRICYDARAVAYWYEG